MAESDDEAFEMADLAMQKRLEFQRESWAV